MTRLLDWLNRTGKRAAVRLNGGVHPKRRHKDLDGFTWYLPHLNVSDTVLDLGCGNLEHTAVIAHRVRRVIGLDREPALPPVGAPIRVVPHDLETVPLPLPD